MTALLLGVALADCELASIQTDLLVLPGAEITRGVSTPIGWLATGSVVRLAEACEGGRMARVLSESWHYRHPEHPSAPHGATACLPPELLHPLGSSALIALSPPPGAPPSDPKTPAMLHNLTCTETGYAADEASALTVAELAWIRPISPLQEAHILAVQQAYTRNFGPIPLGAIPFTDWGYVGLPLPHRLSEVEIAAEVAAEGLVTDKQREKVTTDLGPLRDGIPIYTHFTGADPRFTDLWAKPTTIISLLDLAARWAEVCEADNPRACTLQIGDLAYYSDQRPDPLGHRDHSRGTCVDIRLFRQDGSRYESYYNRPDDRTGVSSGYSADLTGSFLRTAAGEARILYFNDPAVIVDVPAVQASRGHDDHIHLCF